MEEIQFRYRRRLLLTISVSGLSALLFVLLLISGIRLLEYILTLNSHETVHLLTYGNLPLLCTVFTFGGILCFAICFSLMHSVLANVLSSML